MKVSKKQLILEWLESGKPLTALMAVQLFSCMNLSRIISKLKKEGHDIKTEYFRYSGNSRWVKYFMDINNK